LKLTKKSLRKKEAETLAGLFLKYQEFPSEGPENFFSNCLFTIETVDKKRIKQIKVTVDV
jgi:Mg2+/Co2+ transporter CorB